MDGKDDKILAFLSENARIAFTNIAKKLKVSEATVRKRVRVLEDKGVIKKYSIEIDHAKIGFNTIALVGLDVEPDKFLEVSRKIAELKEVKKVFTSSGDHMIMSEVWTRNGKELSDLLDGKISKLKGVSKICPAIILERVKE